MTAEPPVTAWLEAFARCVRARDFEAGEALFARDVVAFGTRVERAEGLDALRACQWGVLWPQTRGFRYLDPVATRASDDGSLVTVLALWESEGLSPAGKAYPRRGRCTVVLRRAPDAPTGWRAVHSHHSTSPDGSNDSAGPARDARVE